jgi:geranylgeranyl pyrophosphate synthase
MLIGCLIGENCLIDANFLIPVQDQIVFVEEKMRARLDGHHPTIKTALNHLLTSGGKRIRVAVTLLVGGMLNADQDRLITLAAAIESLHTATLVHDDLIDGALIRRGIPTLNAQWSSAATVLTGDFLFARAAKLAAETESIPLMHLFAETLATIVNGEITQMFAGRGVADREAYYRRIYAKTASLFESATTSAAILGDVEDSIVKRVGSYGYETGMAFQIIDDILDFTGEQATMGKPVASDLRQGLITLPALYYIETNPDDEDMKVILSNEFCDEECIHRMVDNICDSGAIQKSLDEAKQAIYRGLASLDGLPEGPEHDGLVELADYIISRDI